jgi:uncharacterized repeat protein (TIGR02543 family)
MTNGTVAYGSNYAIPANAFSRTGYLFLRWNTDASGNGTSYAAETSIPNVTANITLYAIWELVPYVLLMDFDDGQTLEQNFDTIVDGSDSVTIASTNGIGGTGNALRRNLGAEHTLDLGFTGLNNFWLRYDVYIQSTDALASVVHAPLILVHGAAGTEARYLGVPLYNGVQVLPSVGFNHLRPLTNVLPASIADRFANLPIEIPGAVTGRWINIKYHVKLDNANAGLDVYIDRNVVLQTIRDGDASENLSFNLLEVTYHDVAAPNTNIYMDNIGIYLTDPDL